MWVNAAPCQPFAYFRQDLDDAGFDVDAHGVAVNYRPNSEVARRLQERAETLMAEDSAANALEAMELFVRACVRGSTDWRLRETLSELFEQLQHRFASHDMPPQWRVRYWRAAELLAPHIERDVACVDTPYFAMFPWQEVRRNAALTIARTHTDLATGSFVLRRRISLRTLRDSKVVGRFARWC